MRIVRRMTLQELKALPTLEEGVSDDLKRKTKTQRVWLSRMTTTDGAACDNLVVVDSCDKKGNWHIVDSYQAVDEETKPATAAPSMFAQLGAIVDAFNDFQRFDLPEYEDE